jgi:hypothetical protein
VNAEFRCFESGSPNGLSFGTAFLHVLLYFCVRASSRFVVSLNIRVTDSSATDSDILAVEKIDVKVGCTLLRLSIVVTVRTQIPFILTLASPKLHQYEQCSEDPRSLYRCRLMMKANKRKRHPWSPLGSRRVPDAQDAQIKLSRRNCWNRCQ